MKKFWLFFWGVLSEITIAQAGDLGHYDFNQALDVDFWKNLQNCTQYETSVEVSYVFEHYERKGVFCKNTTHFHRAIKPDGEYCLVSFSVASSATDVRELQIGEDDFCAADGSAPGGCKFPMNIVKDINKQNIGKYFAQYCDEM